MTMGVVPCDQRAGLGDDRDEVARVVQLLEEVQTSFASRIARGSARGHANRQNRQDRLVSRRAGLLPAPPDRVFRLRKGSAQSCGKTVLDQVGVRQEEHHAIIVALLVAIRVLDAIRDFVPGGNLVGLRQSFSLGGRTKGKAHVDDVGGLAGPCCPCWP